MELLPQTQISKTEGPTLRSRQHKRLQPEIRPVKRLFTPAIKRHLKSWLVRRRENPYPNREEKIKLAEQTGLTYIQVCNWFANWRRKLKNSGKNVDEFTWSTLIKSYNDQALGNVEHLSISSDDSIWEDTEIQRRNKPKVAYPEDHCYTSSVVQGISPKTPIDNRKIGNQSLDETIKSDCFPQCFQISSTTDFLTESTLKPRHKIKRKPNYLGETRSSSSNKRSKKRLQDNLKKTFRDKNWNYRKMMEKFVNESDNGNDNFQMSLVLSKWRKSAALFRPNLSKTCSDAAILRKKMTKFHKKLESFHGREELDAAEALTFLARASMNK